MCMNEMRKAKEHKEMANHWSTTEWVSSIEKVNTVIAAALTKVSGDAQAMHINIFRIISIFWRHDRHTRPSMA